MFIAKVDGRTRLTIRETGHHDDSCAVRAVITGMLRTYQGTAATGEA